MASTLETNASQRSSIQQAWDDYSWDRINAEEFACLVATILQLDNNLPPKIPGVAMSV